MVIIMMISGVFSALRANVLMDQYGNLGPYQDPKIRQWWDELEVERDNEE